MENKTALRIPKKYEGRIGEVIREDCDDTESNLAYVIHLSDGWCAGDDHGVHTLIEYSQKEALERLRNTVLCDCSKECVDANKLIPRTEAAALVLAGTLWYTEDEVRHITRVESIKQNLGTGYVDADIYWSQPGKKESKKPVPLVEFSTWLNKATQEVTAPCACGHYALLTIQSGVNVNVKCAADHCKARVVRGIRSPNDTANVALNAIEAWNDMALKTRYMP